MGKRFWLILAVVVVAMVGIFIILNKDSKQPASTNSATPSEVVNSDHVRGNVGAKAILVEYGDFQCPACGSAYPMIKQLKEAFPNDLKIVFRHFPLSNIHPNAFGSSRAAEAAGAQGKFFEMHDLLYERQERWSSSNNAVSIFRDFAKELGLDVDKFNQDYNSNTTSARINSDINSGKAAGVDATPTFYLNGQKLEPNPRSFEEYKAKVQAVLAAQ